MLNNGESITTHLGSYDMYKMFVDKFKNTKAFHCNSKIREIDLLLILHSDKDKSNNYIIKLNCERNAAIGRKYLLKKDLFDKFRL